MESPEMLWLMSLLLPLLWVLYRSFKRGRRELGRFKGRGAAENLFDTYTIKWFFISLFFFLFVSFAVLSLIGFRSDREKPQNLPPEVDIMCVVDLSRSMLAEDVEPSRLERAKTIIRGIADRVRKARYGITVYKGDAYRLLPMTEDLNALKSSLDFLSPSLYTSPGTNIEKGVRMAVDGFPDKELRRKVILLFTDGESHKGNPGEAAAFAAREDVIVHVVGIGTEEGGHIPLGENRFVRDGGGEKVVSSLEKEVLRSTAESGKGVFVMVSGRKSLSALIEDLELEAKEEKIRYETEGRYRSFLSIAVIFFFLSILVRVIPWRGTL